MQPRHDSAINRARLASLERLASAEGEARRLRAWMVERDRADQKRQDDRVKVLVGAAVLELLKAGQQVSLPGSQALLELMTQFLIRPSDREAVLGDDGRGSEALRRVLGLPQADSLSGGSEAAQSDDGEAVQGSAPRLT